MNISDVIERFILDNLGEDLSLNVSRNELANYFNCAPSQINYVLNTRFTSNKGFSIDSRKGGGGYVKIVRIIPENSNYLQHLISCDIGSSISYPLCCQILDGLVNNKYITPNDSNIIKIATNPRSLANPFKMEDGIRANIMKNILINIIKEK